MTSEHHSAALSSRSGMAPVLMRLGVGVPCSPELARRVEALAFRSEAHAAKARLQAEDDPVRRPRYLVSGWACRHRLLPDGRRQIFDLVLPGESVGVCLRPHPLANASTIALTPVRLVDASPLLALEPGAEQDEFTAALHAQAAADERRALNQIMRLGRLTALERLADLLLELHERLAIVGEVEGDRLPLPLTQETLADLNGLSVVHVNRTLQELRREGLVRVERGWATLLDRRALAQLAGVDQPQH